MSDQNEPEPGMPTAGRKPAPEPEADEATQRLGDQPTPFLGDGGATQRLSAPMARPGAEDKDVEGPTVETPKPAPIDPDGPTRRLSLPAELPPTSPPALPPLSPPVSPPGEGPTRRISVAPEPVATEEPEPAAEPAAAESEPAPAAAPTTGGGVRSLLRQRPTPAGLLVLVLMVLVGFTLVVQLRSNSSDEGLASARQEDLVRILSDLEAQDGRLQSEISALENSQRQLTSGVAGRQAALAEAQKRSDELGLLAGTKAGRGPGLRIVIDGVKASAILNTVQELRGSGGEVMQIAGNDGQVVRIVASSYFVDAEGGGIVVDGKRLTGPYVLTVIGQPQIMQPALQIPGGVVASVNSGGGSVTLEQRTMVEVTALRDAKTLQFARPAS